MKQMQEAIERSAGALRSFLYSNMLDKRLVDKLFSIVYDTKASEYSTPLLLSYMDQLNMNQYTFEHSVKVAWISTLLSKWMNLDIQDCKAAMVLGLLHDVGKIGMPTAIINKPARLSAKEFDLIKQHPYFGSFWLRASEQISDRMIDIVSSHHEKPNGKGYPNGTNQEPVLTRILSVADVYEAMTGKRPYKNSFSVEDTLHEMQIMSEQGDLDLRVFKVFREGVDKIVSSDPILSDASPTTNTMTTDGPIIEVCGG